MDRKEKERFDDLCYEAWASGRNPDDVSRDGFDSYIYKGCDFEDISLDMVLPKLSKEKKEEMYDNWRWHWVCSFR